MIAARFISAVLGIATPLAAQVPSYGIRSFAGTPYSLGDNGPAVAALLRSPRGVFVDGSGNIYIADTGNARIRKVTTGGTITTIAGSNAGFAGDGGSALSAQFAFPTKIVAAANGDLYIADSSNHRIRRITSSGAVSTVAGSGQPGYNGDDMPAVTAELTFPGDIAIDANGSVLIADTNNARIRRINSQGIIATAAGSGNYGFQGDNGPAALAAFASPRGIAIDAAGNIYIADTLNHRIRKITTDGAITTIAGTVTSGYSGDGGQALFAQLSSPSAVAVDRQSNVYVADSANHRIRKITPQGSITTVAGTGINGFAGDNGPASAAQLNSPEGVAVDAAGNLYIADTENHRIRKVNAQGVITTVAGSDPGAGDKASALSARLFEPSGIAIDSAGNTYIADSANHRVRVVSPQGVIQNHAGNGAAGYSGDNNIATAAQLNSPNGLAFDRAGNLYVADTANHVIRKISGGAITTVAGSGQAGKDGDFGPAASARLFNPSGVAFDNQGNLYIADSGNNKIRLVSPAGTIRTYAGEASGLPGFAGDGGPAPSASFNYPVSLAFDDAGNLFVSDYYNNRIRKITPNGALITTYAGTGAAGSAGDEGPASQAELRLPAGLAFDNNHNLLIADLLNNRIRSISPNGFIHTIAGSGLVGDSGDGNAALQANLSSPRDIAADAAGNIYFSDQDNQRVRRLTQTNLLIRTVVNAASGIAGPVAPGEAITILGSQLGGDVTFDGDSGQVIYSSLTQVNVIVPHSVAGKSTTVMRVKNSDLADTTFTLTVRDAAPGIFTANSSGTGQAAVINQDGTINSPANPAPRGSIIAIYGTGGGIAAQSAVVRIEGLPSDVSFSGETAPGLYQVNARVPVTAFALDNAPLELTIGSFAAQPSVTVAIR